MYEYIDLKIMKIDLKLMRKLLIQNVIPFMASITDFSLNNNNSEYLLYIFLKAF